MGSETETDMSPAQEWYAEMLPPGAAMSLSEFAQRMGYSPNAVYRWFRRKPPSLPYTKMRITNRVNEVREELGAEPLDQEEVIAPILQYWEDE